MIFHTNILSKQSLRMGFIIFICLRTFGIKGYVIWDGTVLSYLRVTKIKQVVRQQKYGAIDCIYLHIKSNFTEIK